jgi:Circularly permutated YpsA SLOG family
MIGERRFPHVILSGGQTGVDRAALDMALEMGIPHDGWCPRGRVAEDGRIPLRYRLRETESPQYWVRTERNVADSDGTLILFRERLQGGTQFTFRMTEKHRRPCLLVDLSEEFPIAETLIWLQEHGIVRLNVAGPRERTAPGIYAEAVIVLRQLLSQVSSE